MQRLFLDIDGVLADFSRAACKVFGAGDEVWEGEGAGVYDIPKLLGISQVEFWERLDADEYFWVNLEVLPHARDLVNIVSEKYKVYLLSTACLDDKCYSGKFRWVSRYFPEFTDRLILSKRKSLIAGPGRILIDDYDVNCRMWKERGGTSILYPQPWNSNHQLSKEGFEYTIETLLSLYNKENS